ncbi:MAG: methylenetetrahydrofolate reductase [NAD(P)H] [Planctomycetes bacterium]|jgi:methylenetetrahydrofolate reductase (NADPH)|nr:methylenetetrahydrofolate reductase [NAD(P)H] [Planctomycetota bacterium]
MVRIADLFAAYEAEDRRVVSFEFFPPKTDEAVEELFRVARDELAPLAPSFISVTYGAGGSTRRKTLELVSRIKNDIGLEAMAHLTCVGHSRDELAEIIDGIVAAGIENVLALRGDPPTGETEFRPAPDGFRYGSELIAFIRDLGAPLCLAAACYPEKHPEAATAEQDLANLKAKVDAGADYLVTQLFFNNADFFAFQERARAIGIAVPIVPGIMPITNYKQVRRFTRMCGTHIPVKLTDRLKAAKNDRAAVTSIGISYAIDQCRELLANDVPGLHFYTLNKSSATRAILSRLRHAR